MVKGVNFLSGVKKRVFVISECGLHMVYEVLAECLRVFTHLCTTEEGHCMPSLNHLDYLLLSQSFSIIV